MCSECETTIGLLSAVYIFMSNIPVYKYFSLIWYTATATGSDICTFATNCIHIVYSTRIPFCYEFVYGLEINYYYYYY